MIATYHLSVVDREALRVLAGEAKSSGSGAEEELGNSGSGGYHSLETL
jgi:hypothetical protein